MPLLVAHASTDFDGITAHRQLKSYSFAQGKFVRNRSCQPTLTDVCRTTPKGKSVSRPIDGDRQATVEGETREVTSFAILSHSDLDENQYAPSQIEKQSFGGVAMLVMGLANLVWGS
jgi:hypothetical protein